MKYLLPLLILVSACIPITQYQFPIGTCTWHRESYGSWVKVVHHGPLSIAFCPFDSKTGECSGRVKRQSYERFYEDASLKDIIDCSLPEEVRAKGVEE